MDLQDIRKKIDRIDDEILELFLKRMELSNLAIEEKLRLGKTLRDEAREGQIIQNIVEKSGDYSNYSKILFEIMMSLSRHRQFKILKENPDYLKKDNFLDLSSQFDNEIEDLKKLWSNLEV